MTEKTLHERQLFEPWFALVLSYLFAPHHVHGRMGKGGRRERGVTSPTPSVDLSFGDLRLDSSQLLRVYASNGGGDGGAVCRGTIFSAR